MAKTKKIKHLWDSSKTKQEAIDFAAGWDIKQKPLYENLLIPYQIKLDRVFSNELFRQGHINKNQADVIRDGLTNLEFKTEKLSVEGYEDVHSFVESKLAEQHGELVGNLHLGLSRNDQICTIMRMFMNDKIDKIDLSLVVLTVRLGSEIKGRGARIIPGYTHHRVAMPSTYGLLLESYMEKIDRVRDDLSNWNSKYNKCPLGSAAGFGSPLKIDRTRVAKELGFYETTKNSLDAVSSRWEAEAGLAFALSLCMNHFSNISQDLIFMSSAGINVIELPSDYCTGSSIMPQKRNPDVLEVIKAKASVMQGITSSIMSIGKGNISGYNRDTQWTKYLIIDAINEFEGVPEILSEIIKGIKINEKRSKQLLRKENAYSAEKAIKKAIMEKTAFRSTKLRIERKLKR